ncbi:hypothetical protein BDY17DRAFT_308214 [Neohortaea acidophila]|uniref:CUE domain-containing protein n=1 Tax=Neohortaea acidophila TaxID=245834 RepID=A0A6A6Q487_9PEZI|nr:uncharacterized protein BDY17DRAFT_308214 [Neohortaea acidophila]KAF2486849.1 hypothetical protein BDY17DRAFT_308214 [Neohortaea acidophila]
MADNPQSPLKHEESATTREEMDFDDNDHDQAPSPVSPIEAEPPIGVTPSKKVSFQETAEEVAPPKPPRPLSPQQQAEHTLIEAFPTIDTKVVKAVLMASGGQVEPAFNALLGMSDPDFTPETQAPPRQPPRPTQRAPMSQLEADEQYARQLAEQYNSGGARSQTRYNQREPARRGPNLQPRPAYGDDEDRNFFDDDLPEIGRNIQQGFVETQKKVNSWFTNFRKKIDGQDEDEDEDDLYSASQSNSRKNTGGLAPGRQNFGASQSEQLYGIQKQAEARQRQSTEASRYDADPHEMGADDFERLELRDDDTAPGLPPRTSSRKTANPDLFKSAASKPPQSGPVDEVEAVGDPADAKARKWQPLTSVAPHPEEDNDPFSLGDDDEDKGEDLRKEDSNRLKEAARNSISGPAPAKQLEESERSGSKNLEAEELLSGKKE